ncbi:PRC-barrel domain-containing protein [Bradyrhizobium sp. CB1650]|uniref:PRC-barrel domain-containing protein n=1 Tax=Bradyrhizobium sp. CB1650 TaxID=3039153 RepID=UPI002434F535|nr:PRC-barrel domain-containing protein [Bradyrhizobium sp. CB1650]WGD53205.1 PRC-barrel domain-containing protein [Bradyrhizobium sp. CB1650]
MNNSIQSSNASSVQLEGATVIGPDGDRIGSIESVTIDRTSGSLSHVVTSVRRFGFVAVRHLLPWHRLDYDRRLAAYRVDFTHRQLQAASLPQDPFGYGL